MQQMYPIPGCVVRRVVGEAGRGTVIRVLAARAEAHCPTCRTVSRAPHSTYTRRPADLPSLGRRIRLEIAVRRSYCAESTCTQRAFDERPRSARRARAPHPPAGGGTARGRHRGRGRSRCAPHRAARDAVEP